MRRAFHASAPLLALVVGYTTETTAQFPSSLPAPRQWVASWATAVQGPEPSQPGAGPAALADTTVRQIVHLSVGGNSVRVQFSNAFGTQPLCIDAAAVARATAPNASSIIPGTAVALNFAGEPDVLIPAGATFLSDPVAFQAAPLTDLAITFHLPAPPAVESAHPGSRATSYLLHGRHTQDLDLLGAAKIVRWLQLAEVDVATRAGSTLVALGDSITDGHGATTDGNDRWPDVLATRLQAARPRSPVAIVNEGIGGNHLLTDSLGQNVLARFDRDVLAVAGVHFVLVLEGINDLGALARTPAATPEMHRDLVLRMESAYAQVIERARAHGLKVYGATVMPDTGSSYYHPTATDEADRKAVNAWIRQPGHFDGVVDFDQVMRDPAHPAQLLPAFDSGDHLHPGPAGYKAMGEAIPLAWFR